MKGRTRYDPYTEKGKGLRKRTENLTGLWSSVGVQTEYPRVKAAPTRPVAQCTAALFLMTGTTDVGKFVVGRSVYHC
jgi:hypothetical protein